MLLPGVFDDYYCTWTGDTADPKFYDSWCTWFANMGMPIPKFKKKKDAPEEEKSLWSFTGSIEFWSVLIEFRPFQAFTIFSLSNSFFFTLISVFAFYRYQNLNGSEGFAYNLDPRNREDIEPVDW